MKRETPHRSSQWLWLAMAALFALPANSQTQIDSNLAANNSTPIPMDQLGAVAGKQYQGDGLSVAATPGGARLRCAFQRLDGEVIRDGLWLRSTAGDAKGERFRVRTIEVGRVTPCAPFEDWLPPGAHGVTRPTGIFPGLPCFGVVTVDGPLARFIRDGLTEEYSVSVDGVRQDFVVAQRPEGEGQLRVELDVTGAKTEPLVNGARLVLDSSGRKLAYNRLRAVDARGQELTARLEVTAATRLTLAVDDAAAVYPVRIDPTFSDADWISMGTLPGVDGSVYATVVDGFGNLYIGGNFTVAGEIVANKVAKWDGNVWSALGLGVNTNVNALAVSGSDLYVGGIFTTAGGVAASRIAKWNGNTWSALGVGLDNVVNALVVTGSDLYVGGNFSTAGGMAASRIAKWDGSAWSALGAGLNGGVLALAVSGSDLYVGGYFTNAGGVAANYIAKWDGSGWSALGSGMGEDQYPFAPFVAALAVSGTNLYAGGSFTTAGGVSAYRVAKWDGSAWSALGVGIWGDGTIERQYAQVYALAVLGSDLYVGGEFAAAGGSNANYVAKWDGSAWSALGSRWWSESPFAPTVTSLAVSSSGLYVGGNFRPGAGGASGIVKWDGIMWSGLGSGINNVVVSLALSGSDLYVGGIFGTAGGSSAKQVAKWNGSVWSDLGLGIVVGGVYALAVSGTDLYVGGNFATTEGNIANHVAKWNGSAWSSLGSGMNSSVYVLAVSGTDLYAGGKFTTAGGMAANYIAKWDGSAWSALGSGVSGASYPYVSALAVSGSDLYVGGNFTTAGGNSANRVAKWNGSAWSALGSGMGGDQYPFAPNVAALTVSGTDLYAGGNFTTAGGMTANYIAKWDGSAWSPLGSGMNNWVYALAVSGSDLYVGGNFTTAGGNSANRIAKWNGSAWSALGSGMNGYVAALAVSSTNLYAGGGFTTAGNKVSTYVAKANIGAARGKFSNLIYSPATGFSCTFSDGTVGQPYRIQTSPSLAVGSWTDFTNFIYAGPVVITDASAVSTTNIFYRAVTP